MATGALWPVANVVAARIAGPTAGSRALGVVGSGAMLANVVGVPLGSFAGQAMGWRGPAAGALPAVRVLRARDRAGGPARAVRAGRAPGADLAGVRFAGKATLGSALTVSAFNRGCADSGAAHAGYPAR
ncbi:hypothetical protein ACH4Q9_08720 [Streptomyces sp. NPDC021086]|uniref:hypothetical protein n=1 Tax=Streptomyces sp. NPDC021086 TaxID=3365111 RepID=UPI00379AF89B